MSTGMECTFIEPEAGKWFYALQNWSCPAGAWDWRQDASCFGSFASYDDACEHLRDHHANPGGHGILEAGDFEMDDIWRGLIASATYVS
jgi:hypothetical protein